MAENEIGRCRCPICGNKKAHLRVNVKQLAYIICNTCNVQVQARSDRSDELMRALHVPEEAEPVHTPKGPAHVHTSELAPPPIVQTAHVQTPTPPAPAPANPPKPAASVGWGMLRGVPTR